MTAWSRLRESFWFIPAVMCLAAVLLAEGLIVLDGWLGESRLGLLGAVITRVGESGSRDLLGAIAGSMLAVASTTFSITIAVLAVSSSTYGPRLVRNFMADRGNQVVLGTFVATFLYSLMVLRSIRDVGDPGGAVDYFVPHVAVNTAVLLALASIGVLVYFIHHISDSVQVWTLADEVRRDLVRAVERLHPADAQPAGAHPADPHPGTASRVSGLASRSVAGEAVASRRTGYVHGVDVDRLAALAAEHDVVVELGVRPGEHVVDGGTLARVRPPGRIDDDALGSIRNAVRIGRARKPEEDVQFPALLLEEMAVRALSPGTNDPYTAINALDNLASGLVVMAGRAPRSPDTHDDAGQLRVVAPQVSCIDLVDHVVDAMRVYALSHPTVLHRTLTLVDEVGQAGGTPSVRRRLDDHVRDLVEALAATSPHPRDLASVSAHASQVRERLARSAARPR